MTPFELALAALFVVGLVGVVVPVIPGLILCVVGVLCWAVAEQSVLGWSLLAVCVLLYGAGVLLQLLVPGRRMRQQGIRTTTMLGGVVAAIALGFVIPVVGLFIGFPVGVFLVQLGRTRDAGAAVRATGHALRAVGTNILIELVTAFAIVGAWTVTVLLLDHT